MLIFKIIINLKKKIDYVENEGGKNKGFAFVEYEDIANSEKAIKSLNGKKINGRKIVVFERNIFKKFNLIF